MKMFADLPTPSPTELNTFLSCVLVVIGLILGVSNSQRS
jgi:hypothetical protein